MGGSREQQDQKIHVRSGKVITGRARAWRHYEVGKKNEYARERWGRECELGMSRECVRTRKRWQSGREGNGGRSASQEKNRRRKTDKEGEGDERGKDVGKACVRGR